MTIHRDLIDQIADQRETCGPHPLGIGHYSEAVRATAADLAQAWSDAAAEFGVLVEVSSLHSIALDASAETDLRRRLRP